MREGMVGVLIGLVLFLRTFVHFCKIATVFNSIYLPSRVVKPVLILIVILFTHHMFPTRDHEPRMARGNDRADFWDPPGIN